MQPEPVLLFHITHLDNLPNILRDGCLYCHRQMHRTGLHPVDIAYPGIQDRRATTQVPCGPGGVLHDYVPFYFAPRSPMLFAIHKNQVAGYSGGQTPIVHLVSSVARIQTTGCQFVFTDGHATMSFSRFFTEIADLDQIDWTTMQSDTGMTQPKTPTANVVARPNFWCIIRSVGRLCSASACSTLTSRRGRTQRLPHPASLCRCAFAASGIIEEQPP